MRRIVSGAFAYCPPGRFHSIRILWILGPLVCLMILAVPAVPAMRDVAIPNRKVYFGSLSSLSEPIVLELPAGVPLGEILVAAGDEIAAGETLATLDRSEMESRLDDIRREIIVGTGLRSCLLSQGKPDVETFETSQLDAETRTELAAAMEDCALQTETEQLAAERLAAERNAVIADIALLEASRRVLMDSAMGEIGAKRQLAGKVITLAAERNELELRRDELDLAHRDGVAARRQARLDRVDDLTDTLDEARTAEAHLKRHLDLPRLTLPRGGTVLKVRKISPGTVLHEASPILEIRPDDVSQYLVRFDVPLEEIDDFRTEDPVRITLYENIGADLDLRGRIHSMEPTGSGSAVRISAALEDDSLAQLMAHPVAIGLEVRNSAARVSVGRVDTTLPQSTRLLIADLAHSFTTGWTAIFKTVPSWITARLG